MEPFRCQCGAPRNWLPQLLPKIGRSCEKLTHFLTCDALTQFDALVLNFPFFRAETHRLRHQPNSFPATLSESIARVRCRCRNTTVQRHGILPNSNQCHHGKRIILYNHITHHGVYTFSSPKKTMALGAVGRHYIAGSCSGRGCETWVWDSRFLAMSLTSDRKTLEWYGIVLKMMKS